MTDPKPLIFDVVGPFVVQFQQGKPGQAGTARIYAPFCENHHANILTDSDDIYVDGLAGPAAEGYLYGFKDGLGPAGAPQYTINRGDSEQLLLVNHERTQIPEGECRLAFEVPCPNRILPLHAEDTWIHQNEATKWVIIDNKPGIVNKPRARSLRFIYDSCPQQPSVERKKQPSDPKVPDFPSFNAETAGFPNSHYTMTLRFASACPVSEGHEDAYRCFRIMRKLASENLGMDLHKWRVDFDHLAEAESKYVGGANPRDCGTALLVLQDW
jgi:hypothetical protein